MSGEEVFRRHYGDVRPIPAERLVVVEDGQRLMLGKSTLTFLHTPGHALHHVSIVARGSANTGPPMRSLLSMDIELNAKGLLTWLGRRAR